MSVKADDWPRSLDAVPASFHARAEGAVVPTHRLLLSSSLRLPRGGSLARHGARHRSDLRGAVRIVIRYAAGDRAASGAGRRTPQALAARLR